MDYSELLFGLAQIAEGTAPSDPTRFSKLVGELMLAQDA